MKTASGYTSETEARAVSRTRHVVWYYTNPGGTVFYVPFASRHEAERFARSHGFGLPEAGPAHAGICGEPE